jgi:hypothetical protein
MKKLFLILLGFLLAWNVQAQEAEYFQDGLETEQFTLFPVTILTNPVPEKGRIEIKTDGKLFVSDGIRWIPAGGVQSVNGLTDTVQLNLSVSRTGNDISVQITGANPIVFNVEDGDGDSTNEYQNLSLGIKSGTVQPVNIENGAGVNIDVADNDNDPTNELDNTDEQDLSFNLGTGDLSISGGNGTNLDGRYIPLSSGDDFVDKVSAEDIGGKKTFKDEMVIENNGGSNILTIKNTTSTVGVLTDIKIQAKNNNGDLVDAATLTTQLQNGTPGAEESEFTIGVKNASYAFRRDGKFRTKALTIWDGAGSGKWLGSDASGNASWKDLPLIDLKLLGNELSITNDLSTVDLTKYLDNTDDQNLNLSGDILSLESDPTAVDLSPYKDNTDEQDLSFNSSTGDLSISGGNGANLDGRYVRSAEKGIANGVANLDGSGKIYPTQLPAIAFTDVYQVATIAIRDDLVAKEGDVAIVADIGNGEPNTYIWDDIEWVELKKPADNVSSVNGQSGVVSLTTSDIPEGTNKYYTSARVNADAPNVTLSGESYLSMVNQAITANKINLSSHVTGTLADVSLSSNVALKNIDNNFTTQTITANGATATTLRLNNTGVNGREWWISSGQPGIGNNGFTIRDNTALADRLYIDNDGNINNISGEYQLNGTSINTAGTLSNVVYSDGTGGDRFVFGDNNRATLRMGNVASTSLTKSGSYYSVNLTDKPSGTSSFGFLNISMYSNGTSSNSGVGWMGIYADENADRFFMRRGIGINAASTTFGDWRELYHTGNSNNSTTPWNAQTYSIAGTTVIDNNRNYTGGSGIFTGQLDIGATVNTGQSRDVLEFTNPLLATQKLAKITCGNINSANQFIGFEVNEGSTFNNLIERLRVTTGGIGVTGNVTTEGDLIINNEVGGRNLTIEASTDGSRHIFRSTNTISGYSFQNNTETLLNISAGGVLNGFDNWTTTGTVTATDVSTTSDIRLKANMNPVKDLKKFDDIDFISYYLRSDSTKRLRYGVKAQDLEKIAPEMVYTTQDSLQTKSVSYQSLLIAKVARQDQIIKQQTQDLSDLKSMVYLSYLFIGLAFVLLLKVKGRRRKEKV